MLSETSVISNPLFLSVLERLSPSFVVVDNEWRILHMSHSAQEWAGRSPAFVAGRILWESFPAWRGTPVEAQLRAAATTGKQCSIRVQAPQGAALFDLHVFPAAQELLICADSLVAAAETNKKLTNALNELAEVRQRLTAKLNGMRRLYQIGSHLLHPDEPKKQLQEIIEAAIDITGSDMGNIQLVDDTGNLKIVAQKDFGQEFLDYFENVTPKQSACGLAMEQKQRVIVEDVTKSRVFKDPETLKVMLNAGVRAVQSTPLIDESGHLLGILSTHNRQPRRPLERDLRLLDLLALQAVELIERNHAHEARRASEATLQAIVDNVSALVYVKDIDGRFLLLNRHFETALGIDRTKATGKTDSELFGSEFAKIYQANDRRVAETGEPIRFEEVALHPDGPHTYLSLKFPLRNPEGAVYAVCGVSTDITEQKRGEEALRNNRKLLSASQKMAHVGSWVLELKNLQDLNSNPLYWSDESHRIFGYEPGAVKPASDLFFGAIPQNDRPSVVAAFFRAIHEGKRYESEHCIVRPDGSERIVHQWATVERDKAGKPIRMLGTCQDVTDRKHMEDELRRLNQGLEQRVAERSAEATERAALLQALASELTAAEERERRRLAQALHDNLQQVLVGARMRATMLSQKTQDPVISTEVEHLTELIHKAIQESRSLTSQLSPPILYDAGLGPALRWLARRMHETHSLHVDVSIDPVAEPERPEISAFLFQAAKELLMNVATHARTDRASIRLEAVEPAGTAVIVEDTGCGFDPSNLTKLRSNGGFGLFSIRQRLEFLGGSFHLSTADDTGTRVELRIPNSSRREQPENPAAAFSPGRAAAHKEEAASHRIRVLLVDDQKILREGLVALLKDQPDLELVGEGGDGEQAIEMASRLRPDVVVMDASMPKLNGVEATRILKAQLPDIRVIGLSMYAEEDMAAAMREAGVSAYLTKDGPVETLAAEIRRVAGRK